MTAAKQLTLALLLSFSLSLLLSFTTFADRVVIRDNDRYEKYDRDDRPQKIRRPIYTTRPSNNGVNVNVDVDVDVNVPETRDYYMPYYPSFAYDYFIIDYPQDDRFIYRTFPVSMWWY